jgi:hypothetical protein
MCYSASPGRRAIRTARKRASGPSSEGGGVAGRQWGAASALASRRFTHSSGRTRARACAAGTLPWIATIQASSIFCASSFGAPLAASSSSTAYTSSARAS